MKETEVGKRKRGARRQGKESSGGKEEEGENEMRGGKGGKLKRKDQGGIGEGGNESKQTGKGMNSSRGRFRFFGCST